MKKIFISHGHDELSKLKLKDFVRDRLNLIPVVLSEQPDKGFTVVEKLEYYSKDCDFALILLTADDETASGGQRARQNVIHELGYFHGKIGRNKVLLLKESGVELFSNISGLVYKEFSHKFIESVFEDIRLAIESGYASNHATSIPRVEQNDAEESEANKKFIDFILDKSMSGEKTFSKQIRSHVSNIANEKISDNLKKIKLKSFLESELEKTKEVVNETHNPLSEIAIAFINKAINSKKQALKSCIEILNFWAPDQQINELFEQIEMTVLQYLENDNMTDNKPIK